MQLAHYVSDICTTASENPCRRVGGLPFESASGLWRSRHSRPAARDGVRPELPSVTSDAGTRCAAVVGPRIAAAMPPNRACPAGSGAAIDGHYREGVGDQRRHRRDRWLTHGHRSLFQRRRTAGSHRWFRRSGAGPRAAATSVYKLRGSAARRQRDPSKRRGARRPSRRSWPEQRGQPCHVRSSGPRFEAVLRAPRCSSLGTEL